MYFPQFFRVRQVKIQDFINAAYFRYSPKPAVLFKRVPPARERGHYLALCVLWRVIEEKRGLGPRTRHFCALTQAAHVLKINKTRDKKTIWQSLGDVASYSCVRVLVQADSCHARHWAGKLPQLGMQDVRVLEKIGCNLSKVNVAIRCLKSVCLDFLAQF